MTETEIGRWVRRTRDSEHDGLGGWDGDSGEVVGSDPSLGLHVLFDRDVAAGENGKGPWWVPREDLEPA